MRFSAHINMLINQGLYYILTTLTTSATHNTVILVKLLRNLLRSKDDTHPSIRYAQYMA